MGVFAQRVFDGFTSQTLDFLLYGIWDKKQRNLLSIITAYSEATDNRTGVQFSFIFSRDETFLNKPELGNAVKARVDCRRGGGT